MCDIFSTMLDSTVTSTSKEKPLPSAVSASFAKSDVNKKSADEKSAKKDSVGKFSVKPINSESITQLATVYEYGFQAMSKT